MQRARAGTQAKRLRGCWSSHSWPRFTCGVSGICVAAFCLRLRVHLCMRSSGVLVFVPIGMHVSGSGVTHTMSAQTRAEGESREWKGEGRDEGVGNDIEGTCAAAASTGHVGRVGGRDSGGESRKDRDNGSAVESVGERCGRAVGRVKVAEEEVGAGEVSGRLTEMVHGRARAPPRQTWRVGLE